MTRCRGSSPALKLVSVIAITIGGLFVGVPRASAYDHTNYAGRPLGTSGAVNDCHGAAYGRVDGSLVLFSAYHCNPASAGLGAGQPAYGHDGSIIGFWASDWGGASVNDFSYIWLETGQVPFIKNEIYRGFNPACPTCADHWTVTTAYPSVGLSCAYISSKFNRTVYQNFQPFYNYTWEKEPGLMTGFKVSGSSCQVQTTINWHGAAYKDSGSPFVYGASTNQPVGIATSKDGSNALAFSTFYDGWNKANVYWLSHGSNVGVHLCYDSNCT